MCTKFYYNNLSVDAVVTPSTENALFPASNIAAPIRTKVYRSTTNSDHIYFDFGAAEPIDSFVAVGHTINGLGFSTAVLELNSVATWTMSPMATITVTIDTLNNICFGSLLTPVNVRYAKLILTSTLGYCEVSKIFIGQMDEIGSNDFSYPVKFKADNLSSVSKNRFNQKFVDVAPTQKLFAGGIDALTNAEVELVYQLSTYCSMDRPFFMRIEAAQIFLDNNRVSGYYYLKDDPQFSYGNGGFWSVDLNLEEGM